MKSFQLVVEVSDLAQLDLHRFLYVLMLTNTRWVIEENLDVGNVSFDKTSEVSVSGF
jgi:hypothetical protein